MGISVLLGVLLTDNVSPTKVTLTSKIYNLDQSPYLGLTESLIKLHYLCEFHLTPCFILKYRWQYCLLNSVETYLSLGVSLLRTQSVFQAESSLSHQRGLLSKVG